VPNCWNTTWDACNSRSATPRALGTCVDFTQEIAPIFTGVCSTCHSGTNPPRGLRLDTYANAMAGGASGNTIVSCQPDASLLYQKISMATPPVGARMPFGGPYLSDNQIARVRLWIEQGAAQSCPVAAARCSDQTPPTFAGIASATLEGASAAKLCEAALRGFDATGDGVFLDAMEAIVGPWTTS